MGHTVVVEGDKAEQQRWGNAGIAVASWVYLSISTWFCKIQLFAPERNLLLLRKKVCLVLSLVSWCDRIKRVLLKEGGVEMEQLLEAPMLSPPSSLMIPPLSRREDPANSILPSECNIPR